MTESCLWNWENNASTPAFQHWERIEQFLGYDPLPPAQTIAEQLVLGRKRYGTTQKQMAGLLGVDPSTLARWERAEREPRGVHLEMIRSLLADCS